MRETTFGLFVESTKLLKLENASKLAFPFDLPVPLVPVLQIYGVRDLYHHFIYSCIPAFVPLQILRFFADL